MGADQPDNPFSFFVALSAYKAALEVRDDLPLPPALGSLHFKTSLSLAPKDHDDQRSLQLSRAYRALGESMHMLADMTQPAHVRNDSHPADEPIEAATFSDHVRRRRRHLVDRESGPSSPARGIQNLDSSNAWLSSSTGRSIPWTPSTTRNRRSCRTTGRRATPHRS